MKLLFKTLKYSNFESQQNKLAQKMVQHKYKQSRKVATLSNVSKVKGQL